MAKEAVITIFSVTPTMTSQYMDIPEGKLAEFEAKGWAKHTPIPEAEPIGLDLTGIQNPT